MTNYERIKNMSVDEMAKRLTACICIESEINFCLEKKECCEMLEKNIEIPNSLCLKCLENWLLKEVDGKCKATT